MASKEILSASNNIMKEVEKLIKKIGGGTVSVGFMGGKYEDGESVPGVAYQNEFGLVTNNQPPRPFFRRMISSESPTWPDKISKLIKTGKYTGNQILEMMGHDIEGALRQSILDLQDPPLSPITIAKKGFSKPLIDTKLMLNSVVSKVDK